MSTLRCAARIRRRITSIRRPPVQRWAKPSHGAPRRATPRRIAPRAGASDDAPHGVGRRPPWCNAVPVVRRPPALRWPSPSHDAPRRTAPEGVVQRPALHDGSQRRATGGVAPRRGPSPSTLAVPRRPPPPHNGGPGSQTLQLVGGCVGGRGVWTHSFRGEGSI